MRWSMCQAVREHTPYLRSTSRADRPFLAEIMSKITSTHVRTGTFVACMHHRVREHGELALAVSALPDPTLAHRPSSRFAADAVGWRDQVDVLTSTVGTDRLVAPPKGFEVLVGVGLADDLATQRGDVGIRAHGAILA